MQKDCSDIVRLKDYSPPAFLVDEVFLDFDLTHEEVLVKSRLSLRRNPACNTTRSPLFLNGEGLCLLRVVLDGNELSQGRDFSMDDTHLVIPGAPDSCTLETEVTIRPADNTLLEGLYRSGAMLCTQCEAEGFRRITFYPDRPDVLARFTVRIVADRHHFPVLLSNGNLLRREELAGGGLRVTWQDPFPKPSYLFALVAGNLVAEEDVFVTRSGREVALRLYLESHNVGRGAHALKALKAAMRWDEDVFDLEYDLDLYMIVAVDDFNAGAMENKGLNIFNSKYVLADRETATDDDFQAVEGVVAHEYFHNWSGNRVTCRDWFQLCLKEGLTVFRDQEFSADQVSRSLKRIQDVRLLRTLQFAEDAGPLAHPVRPVEYREINNFYTVTVYEKGAEVVRMLRNLLGWDRFRQGLALYFERFDGQAATVEDFLGAMAEASATDLTQFSQWYHKAGTPLVTARGHYDENAREFLLTLSQTHVLSPGESEKQNLHVPIAVGLLDQAGGEIPLSLKGDAGQGQGTKVLSLRSREESYRFSNVPSRPIPSLLRGFSAPIKLAYDYTDRDLMFLMVHDRDTFNRWDAAQQLATRVILRGMDDFRNGRAFAADPQLLAAFGEVLSSSATDRGLAAQMLMLPHENFLSDQRESIDIDGICVVREKVHSALGRQLEQFWRKTWQECVADAPGRYMVSPEEVGRRRLKNLCLEYLAASPKDGFWEEILDRFMRADNMTDRLALLATLAGADTPQKGVALDAFYRSACGNSLVLDKWFHIQATVRHGATADKVRVLLQHRDFNLRNPNRVRSVLHAFARNNNRGFHAADGTGYALVAESVLRLDRINPRVAASLAGAFSAWRRFGAERRALMKDSLEAIAAEKELSRDVREIVDRSLLGAG